MLPWKVWRYESLAFSAHKHILSMIYQTCKKKICNLQHDKTSGVDPNKYGANGIWMMGWNHCSYWILTKITFSAHRMLKFEIRNLKTLQWQSQTHKLRLTLVKRGHPSSVSAKFECIKSISIQNQTVRHWHCHTTGHSQPQLPTQQNDRVPAFRLDRTQQLTGPSSKHTNKSLLQDLTGSGE